MDKSGTIVGTAAVSGGLVAIGWMLDERRGGKPLATAGALGIAGAYLAGTYLQNLSLFGAIGRPVVDPKDRRFALTFDDGPDPRHTPEISALLAERGHRGTFFMLGRAVRAHPDVVRQVGTDGHEIACHGDDHRLLAFASPRTIVSQVVAWEASVEAALGRPGTKLVRAPHGVRSPWLASVVRRRGYTLCGWDGASSIRHSPERRRSCGASCHSSGRAQSYSCTTATAQAGAHHVRRPSLRWRGARCRR